MNNILYNQISKYIPFDEEEKTQKEVMLKFIKDNKDVLTRNNEIGHFTASAWIVNKERTKVLMVYHNIFNSWSFIGGHADGEEDLLSVAKREIEEESGVKHAKLIHDGIYGLNVIPVGMHYKKGKFISPHLHLDVEYLFEADEDEELRIKEDENSGVKWIDVDKIEESVTEKDMKPIYLKLNDKIKKMDV